MPSSTDNSIDINAILNSPAVRKRRSWRMLKDVIARHAIALGGISVIFAIVLIFFYLLYVVFPIFKSASVETAATYTLPASDSRILHIDLEEKAESGLRYRDDLSAEFFDLVTGKTTQRFELVDADAASANVSSLRAYDNSKGLVAYGLSDGRVLPVQHQFRVSYPDDIRTVTPEIGYPMGEAGIVLDGEQRPIRLLAMRIGEDLTTIAGIVEENTLLIQSYSRETSLLDEEGTLELEEQSSLRLDITPRFLLLDQEQRQIFAADENGILLHIDIVNKGTPRILAHYSLTRQDHKLTALKFLLGGISLLAGDDRGTISQWFPVRGENNISKLVNIRQFRMPAAVATIQAEQRRKGFLAFDAKGNLGIFYSTAGNKLLLEPLLSGAVERVAITPRADRLLAQDGSGKTQVWDLHNEHPEISWAALWQQVWYESYEKPEYTWQSSAATNDFEPKFSLMPLSFGTLKAAFYAMLIAMPLAICGAIYTAYFMSSRMRQVVKPTIEIMEALPTVILGFLAGLWLAPFAETNLPGLFTLLLVMPLAILTAGFAWDRLPENIRLMIPDGWHAALLIPVVILTAWASIALSQPLEILLFDGDMRAWMSTELGIGFDQRNSIIVGLAMGFAVIPTIFSITEDAIFSVPKHLTFGSLALGATPWQTLIRVVILTASPGIFSAVMIGFGRAVGETMIVLMATGNTPVMDLSIFQGMRTLSANIAVEMPESEVDSSHYRVLFLAALVLFMFTFVLNTLAELVRQRLRLKYSSL